MHLRSAAERVRVLNLVAPAVRFDDRRAFEETGHVCGRRRLAGKRTELLDLRHEADARSLESLDGEGAGDVSGLRDPSCTNEAERTDRTHELRSVHEREPFLCLQANRLETGPRECVRTGENFALRSEEHTSELQSLRHLV